MNHTDAQQALALQSIVVAKGMEHGSQVAQDTGAASGNGVGESKVKFAGPRRWGGRRHSEEEQEGGQGPRRRTPRAGRDSDDASLAGSEARSLHSKSNATSRQQRRRNRKGKSGSRGGTKGEEYELDGLGETESEAGARRRPFWRRHRFWTFWAPLAWMLVLGFIGVMLRIFSPFRTASHIQFWRLFCFLAGLPVIWVVATFILLAVVWFFESQFFQTHNVLYFVIALRAPARNVLVSLLLLPLYIPLFLPQSRLSTGAAKVYDRVLSVIACIIVFMSVNFLKVLLAKLLASYFHSKTHFTKMHEALNKEYYLKVLATPHEANTYRALLAPGDTDGEAAQAARRRQATGLSARVAPRRFMTKLSGGLEKVAGLGRRRAASLPSPDSLDAADARAAARPGGGGLPTVQTLPELRVAEFEPPDPVAPTPQAPTPQAPRTTPPSPSPFAYLAKASAPIEGAAAASTVRANPAAQQAVSRFQHSLSMDRRQAAAAAAGAQAREPPLVRRNSDGGAGVAGILQGMQVAEGAHTLGPGERLVPDARARRQLADHSSADEGKSSRRGRRQGSTSTWARHRRSEAGPERIEEEPEAFEELPSRGEQMTDARGVALVATIHQVERHLRKRQMNIPFTEQLKQGGGTGTSEPEARKLAFFIFWNLKPFEGRSFVEQADLEAFLPPHKAADAFAMLDRDGDGRLTLAELRSSIEEIFRERDNLASQLRDTKGVVGKLELTLGVAMHVCAILFYLMIFGVDIRNVWVLFTSIFLGFAFVFGNSLKQLFEAVLYLFVQHPFDTGDWILHPETSDRVKVEEISLLSIMVRRGDGVRMWVPITQLVPKTCQNISRSDNKCESFKFLVDVGVRAGVLAALEKTVGEFLERREADFAPGHGVQLAAAADPLKLALSVDVQYSHNGADGVKLAHARTDLLQVISDALTELQVVYTQAPLRTLAE